MSVVSDAHVGVYIAASADCPWILGVHGLEEEELPEILVDPGRKTVSVVNSNAFPRVAIVSIEAAVCLDRHRRPLVQGSSRRPLGETKVTTFIVVCPAQSIVDLCYVKLKNIRSIQLDSHFSDSPFVAQPPQVESGRVGSLDAAEGGVELKQFPLRRCEEDSGFMCTQSAGGEFTHFQHSSTYHAVDFRCAVGTEVLAVCDGRVVAVGGPDGGALVTSGGVHVRDLFAWNSVVLEATSGEAVFEYVHIHAEGVRVKTGDEVKMGDVLCLSGASGFCPEPHLHFEAHRPGQEASVPITYQGVTLRRATSTTAATSAWALLTPMMLLGVVGVAVSKRRYKYGFSTAVDQETMAPGLNEEVVRKISSMNNEPEWLLEFRLQALRHLGSLKVPQFQPNHLKLPALDLQKIAYHSRVKPRSDGAIDPELLRTFEKLGVPLEERDRLAGVAVDVVFDSQSIYTSNNEQLNKLGIIFCSFNEAVQRYPELVRKYLGTVVSMRDNYFACLNAAVFSDGSFVYVPKGVQCPIDLSTYFRMNATGTGQFERTLIVCEDQAKVSYIEGCTAPAREEEQPLHAAVVELVAMNEAEIKYATAQNWYAGDPASGQGGVLNLVTKRGLCKGVRSKIIWTQVETGSAVTWKYPSCVLLGEEAHGEFHSVSVTDHHQQADTGTKMIHIGKNTSSKIIAKGISAGKSTNVYRGLVKFGPNATGCRNISNCDSLILSDECVAVTLPVIDGQGHGNKLEHEATTTKLSGDQMLLMTSRGLSETEASSFILEGFCRDVLTKLPLEFAQEAAKLLSVKLEGAVG